MFQRIILKLSGEALQSEDSFGIDPKKLARLGKEIADVTTSGVQVGIVVGGGNIIRGSQLFTHGFDRITADQMGMLATVINGLAIRDALVRQSISVLVSSAISIPGLVDHFDRNKAKRALQQGTVVIFVGGTGNPLVTTDSAAALRGIEVGADLIIKATKVDGVFAADPMKEANAKRYTRLTYDEVLKQQLGVMDLNAILLCKEHALPLRVCNMSEPGILQRIIKGDEIGTLIKEGE